MTNFIFAIVHTSYCSNCLSLLNTAREEQRGAWKTQ